MVLEIFKVTTVMTDDDDLAQKVTPHFGIIIFVHKSNQGGKQKIPFLIIPTQKKEREEFFLEQLSKVDCGFLMKENNENEKGLPFIKFTLKGLSLKESNLIFLFEKPEFVMKFAEIWSEVLPHSKRPRTKITDEESRLLEMIVIKADEISTRYDDLSRFYQEKMSSKRDLMMMSLYANFMIPRVSLKKKELLSKLEEEFRNLPKFVKTHSEFTTLGTWIGESIIYTTFGSNFVELSL